LHEAGRRGSFWEIGVRRQDRYEIRARELAIADGKDPDGRVERPGLRSMPVWCAYRDAARAEHVATETRVVAAAVPSQLPSIGARRSMSSGGMTPAQSTR
jgi:hypothetical protein